MKHILEMRSEIISANTQHDDDLKVDFTGHINDSEITSSELTIRWNDQVLTLEVDHFRAIQGELDRFMKIMQERAHD